jgi:Uma2 family endonuclease
MAELISPAPEAVRMGMSLQDFIEATSDQTFELINGERKPKLGTIYEHSDTIFWLVQALLRIVDRDDLGLVRSETTFILPDNDDRNWVKGSRTPDILFVSKARFAAYILAHPDYRKKPLMIVPDLVIEVVSPTDKADELNEKIDAYLMDGVKLIWILYPTSRKAVVYAPDLEQPRHIKNDDVLDGEDVIPGFQVTLSSLFI